MHFSLARSGFRLLRGFPMHPDTSRASWLRASPLAALSRARDPHFSPRGYPHIQVALTLTVSSYETTLTLPSPYLTLP